MDGYTQQILREIRAEGLVPILHRYGTVAAYVEAEWGLRPSTAASIEESYYEPFLCQRQQHEGL